MSFVLFAQIFEIAGMSFTCVLLIAAYRYLTDKPERRWQRVLRSIVRVK